MKRPSSIKLTIQDAIRLATLLSGSTRNISLYPPGNPGISKPLGELAAIIIRYLEESDELKIGLSNEILFIEKHLLVTAPPVVEEFTERIKSKNIEHIIFENGVTEDELTKFIKMLNSSNMSASDITENLPEKGIHHIRLYSQTDVIDEQLNQEARETYNEALISIRQTFSEIEQQKIPDSSRMLAVTRHFASISLKEPSVLIGLALVKDYDNYTFTHSINVGVLAMALSATIAFERKSIEESGIAGFLHDIGKTSISKEIINKPGRLSAAEFAEMKKHPEKGVKIISEMTGISSKVAQAVLGHHIRHSRKGYPEWAQQLPFNPISEIIAIADCYDASTTLRSYHQPFSPQKALVELRKLAGDYLDNKLVDQFIQMMGEYPIGTLVRLDTNEIAIIYKQNPSNNKLPFIKIVIDSDGSKLPQSSIEKLGESRSGASSIIAEVDPLQKGIDIGVYFK